MINQHPGRGHACIWSRLVSLMDVCTVIVVSLIVLFALNTSRRPAVPLELEATGLSVVDATRQERGFIGPMEDDSFGLSLSDGAGRDAAAFLTYPNGVCCLSLSEGKEDLIRMVIGTDAFPYLELKSIGARQKVWVGETDSAPGRPTGRLVLSGSQDKSGRLEISVEEDQSFLFIGDHLGIHEHICLSPNEMGTSTFCVHGGALARKVGLGDQSGDLGLALWREQGPLEFGVLLDPQGDPFWYDWAAKQLWGDLTRRGCLTDFPFFQRQPRERLAPGIDLRSRIEPLASEPDPRFRETPSTDLHESNSYVR